MATATAKKRRKSTAKPVPKPRKRNCSAPSAPRCQLPHKNCFSPTKVPSKWKKLLKLVPGYDPFLHADGYYFDAQAAQVSIDFFPKVLKHIEGSLAGKPFILEVWQQAIIANLFGWKHFDSQGRWVRRYREVFLYVPRKNGKTPLSAGICLLVLILDNEPGAQIYSAAADREQAGLLYRHACGMVERSTALDNRCRIYKGQGHKSIVLKEDPASSYVVLSSDASTKHGGNSHCVLIDELHAQPNRDLVEVLETSFASENRAQPLFINITTADYDRESICNEKYATACRVRDNDGDPMKPGFDPTFLPVIYEAEQKDDYESEEVWEKANPNLGVSVSRDYLRSKFRRAKEEPSTLNGLLRLHLNMRTQTQDSWVLIDPWDEMAGILDVASLKGKQCYAGLDLGSVGDLSAFVMLFEIEEYFGILPRFWVPEETVLQRTKRDRVPYQAWVDAGWVKTTSGNMTDFRQVRRDILQDCETYGVRKIAIDRLFQGNEMSQELMAEGCDVVAFGQGFANMAAPVKSWKELYLGRKFIHDGNPVMRWMLGNTSVETDPAGNEKPSKKKSTDRIDGVVAWIMARGLMLAQGMLPQYNFYENNELEIG